MLPLLGVALVLVGALPLARLLLKARALIDAALMNGLLLLGVHHREVDVLILEVHPREIQMLT